MTNGVNGDSPRVSGRWRGLLCLGLLSACAAPPPPPVQALPERPADQYLASPRLAARHAALAVAEQLALAPRSVLPGQGAAPATGALPAVWIMPAINRHSGEITASGRELQVLMALDLQRALGEARLVRSTAVDRSSAAATQWVLQPLVDFQRPDAKHRQQGWFRVDVDVSSSWGAVLPGLRLHINPQQFDPTPSRFFQDAPMFLTGQHHRQRLAFAAGQPGVAQKETAQQQLLAIEGLLQQGISAYEAEQYASALEIFSAALQLEEDNLPALSGRYQSLLALEPARHPEAALQALIRAALAQDSLNFRFLFKVSSLEFRDDVEIARQYGSWLKGIAVAASNSSQCLQITGHASRSGSEEINQKLSLARANRVMQQLLRHAPALKSRLRAEGRGFAENLVGSGSDDAVDAIDRRVEFSQHACR